MPVDLPYIRKNVRDFISFINPLADYAPNLNPAEVLQMLRNQFDYDRFITDEDIPTPDDAKIQNLNQLQLSAARYSSIKAFLEYTDSFDEQMSNDKEGVALMTIHKSKGLEFKIVFVIGLVEGITPTKRGDLEEERGIVLWGYRELWRFCISVIRTTIWDRQPRNPSSSMKSWEQLRSRRPHKQFTSFSTVRSVKNQYPI